MMIFKFCRRVVQTDQGTSWLYKSTDRISPVYNNYVKRVIDFSLAIIALIIGFLPLIVVAVLVKLTSKGPVLFKQVRYGRNSQSFVMYKFRTMTLDAPVASNQTFKDMKHYLTPLGAILRKTSIDELPQLINVLKGDMSFVGPRPLASVDQLVLDLRRQSGADRVRPGITGLAQISGRNNISDHQKAAYDIDYARHVSLQLDLAIIIQTIKTVLKAENISRNHENEER